MSPPRSTEQCDRSHGNSTRSLYARPAVDRGPDVSRTGPADGVAPQIAVGGVQEGLATSSAAELSAEVGIGSERAGENHERVFAGVWGQGVFRFEGGGEVGEERGSHARRGSAHLEEHNKN